MENKQLGKVEKRQKSEKLENYFKNKDNISIAFITNLCTHYRYKLFKILAEDYNFDFYFFDDPENTKEDIKHLTIYKDHPKFYYLKHGRILKRLWHGNYDVIVKCTNKKWLFFTSLLLAKLKGAKFVVWHTTWYYPKTLQYKLFSKIFVKILKNYTSAIVVYGMHGKRFLIEKGIDPGKIFIAWQTVDNQIFGRNVSNEEIEDIRDKLKVSRNKKVILYVGRLIELKGLKYLVEALSLINKGNFVFVSVGDGELKEYLEKYCLDHGIDARFPGKIGYECLPPYYKLATLLVLPSITTKSSKETWGLVINEAFNQGCPVVATDAVGAAVGGLIKDGENGFVVPERNSKALAKAMEMILLNNTLHEKLSRNAKEEIKLWTYERQAKGFLDAIKYSIKFD